MITLTKTDIIDGLARLGVRAGMMLEVHCSLSSFGRVDGGAETVISALKQAVGVNGAIVMPSFKHSPPLALNASDKEMGITLKIRYLKDEGERTSMGIVSDTFKGMADVLTGEGDFRVSAWGKNADKHSQSFQYLIDSGGFALLIGVDIYRMSTMHYVEDCLPDTIRDRFKPPEEVKAIYPESEWFVETWTPPVKPWYTIQASAFAKAYISDTMIGNAKCMLVQVKETIELYRQALINDPFALYGLV